VPEVSRQQRFVARRSIRLAAQVLELAKQDIRRRFAGSYMGMFWAVGVPLLTSAVFIVVFGILMEGNLPGRQYAGKDFTTYYFLGYAPWLLFAEVVSRSTSALRDNRNLVTSVKFPHILIPIALFASALVTHAMLFFAGIGLMLANGYAFSDSLALFPVYFVLLALTTLGVAFAFAAVGAFVSDLDQIVPVVLSAVFFTLPILYSPDLVLRRAGNIGRVLLLEGNPLAGLVEGYRTSLMQTGAHSEAMSLIWLIPVAFGVFVGGVALYRWMTPAFADVL